MTEFDPGQGLPAAFLGVGPPSFVELLKGYAPELLPANMPANRAGRAERGRLGVLGVQGVQGAREDQQEDRSGRRDPAIPPARASLTPGGPDHAVAAAAGVPHGTTVLALTFADGVMMAGDRRATSGNVIAQRDLEKVQPADQYSIIAFAGAVGLAADMVKLFQVELEHYEKINGTPLSLDGKARRLATVLRENLALAMQGLAVVPLFAGYDLAVGTGRIFSFEVVGGPYEMRDFYAEGSGSPYARGALKKLHRPGLALRQAAQVCVEALYDAADDDSATGGPDLTRDLYPVIATATADGYRRLPEDEVRELTRAMIDARRERPDGPAAPLR